MTYSEKLKSPQWQKKRLQVLERDNYTCQYCKDDSTELHVHHNSYQYGNEPWDYPLSNFTTLCKWCHAIVGRLKVDYKIISISRRDDLYKRELRYLVAFCEIHTVRCFLVYAIVGNELDLETILSESAINFMSQRLIDVPKNENNGVD